MKVKVFYPNRNGKIEFTPQELEKLLDEVYREGQNDCNCGKSWTWTTPYYNYKDLSLSASDSTNNAGTIVGPDLSTATYAADSATNIIDNFKAETVAESVEACNPEHRPFTVTMKLKEADINKAAEAISSLLNKNQPLRAHEINDVFSGLAKELNF